MRAAPHRRTVEERVRVSVMPSAGKTSLRQALLRVLERKHLARYANGLSVRKNSGSGPALYTVIAYDAARLALADELAQILESKHQGNGGVWVLDEHDVSVICKR